LTFYLNETEIQSQHAPRQAGWSHRFAALVPRKKPTVTHHPSESRLDAGGGPVLVAARASPLSLGPGDLSNRLTAWKGGDEPVAPGCLDSPMALAVP
jgi:hypothetical protein